MKTINFSPGSCFVAKIIDVKPNYITILLEDGQNVCAKIKNNGLPQVRIGDSAAFIVKENAGGKIFIELIKDENVTKKRNVLDVRV